jgi:Contractile injection system tube protein
MFRLPKQDGDETKRGFSMPGTPLSPRLVKGGIVTMDPNTSALQSVIALQYNPDTLTRSLQIQAVQGAQDGTRVDALRLRGPAIETIKFEAELDATDQLEFPKQFPLAVQFGLQPQLAQLEMLVNPTVETLFSDNSMANQGQLEIIPLEQPLTLFVWSKSRVVPVRLTDFSITEEAFDPNLNPIRAKVSLGLRVLNIDDLGFSHPGGHMFMTYLSNKQQLASKATSVAISVLGLGGLP